MKNFRCLFFFILFNKNTESNSKPKNEELKNF